MPCDAGDARIFSKEGETRYQYDLLNEVKVETRTIKRGREFQKPVTAVFNHEADYLGRIQSITYPDGEKLSYSYDKGSQLKKVSGERLGAGYKGYKYVDNILYDEHVKKLREELYGNTKKCRFKNL